jgi:YesN/AraC family two-component response regulator
MNTVYDVSATIPGVSIFIAGNILIGNWLKWAIMIVAYPIIVWIIAATTSNPSFTLLVVNSAAMFLACVYVLVGLLTLLKNRRIAITGTRQLKMTGNGFYTMTEPEKKNDKIGRFLSDDKLTHFDATINKFLTEKKPFLRQKYSLKDLSVDVDISANYLSAFINRYHKVNYNDFINSYRVSQSKEMIINGEWKQKTLEGIASEAGFNNRNTFTAAFKKETGQSPSEYLKEVKKDDNTDRSQSNKAKMRMVV